MKISIVPYNRDWPKMFESEAKSIQKALGDNCINIHHIGSTSVPGLAAKPIIDMIPVVRDITAVDKQNSKMSTLGYEAKGEYGIPFRRYFSKDNALGSYHIHIFEQGNSEIERHLKFRDWIRYHSDDREAYALLKMRLAQKFPNDSMAYCLGKEPFIANIDDKAAGNGIKNENLLSTNMVDLQKTLL